MRQRTKSESSWGNLALRRGTLALGLILGFGFSGCLVLKVLDGIGTPYAERFPVIDGVSDAALLNSSGSWTWHRSAEPADNGGIALDSAVDATGTGFAPLGREGRKYQQ